MCLFQRRYHKVEWPQQCIDTKIQYSNKKKLKLPSFDCRVQHNLPTYDHEMSNALCKLHIHDNAEFCIKYIFTFQTEKIDNYDNISCCPIVIHHHQNYNFFPCNLDLKRQWRDSSKWS